MSEETREILIKGASQLGVELGKPQLEQVDHYIKELQEYGRLTNLTSITREEDIALKHFVDSWTCCLAVGQRGSLVDVGSGAGFPGLPIKILCPQLEVTLLESTSKKAAFLNRVSEGLNLPGLQVVVGRAEEEGRKAEGRECYDYATARAVGALALVAELCLPLLKVGGTLVAQRGGEGKEEALNAAVGLEKLGGRLKDVVSVESYTGADNYLVVIEKVLPTPDRYPRRNGIPQKRPLWK